MRLTSYHLSLHCELCITGLILEVANSLHLPRQKGPTHSNPKMNSYSRLACCATLVGAGTAIRVRRPGRST